MDYPHKQHIHFAFFVVLVALINCSCHQQVSEPNLPIISTLTDASKIVLLNSDGSPASSQNGWDESAIKYQQKVFNVKSYTFKSSNKVRFFNRQFPIHGQLATVSRTSSIDLPGNKTLVIGGMVGPDSKHHTYATPKNFGLNLKARGISNAWILDRLTNRLTEVGAMRNERTDPNLTLLTDGKVLMSGGFKDGHLDDISSAVDIFDPATNQFAYVGQMKYPRLNHSVSAVDRNHILLVSGKTASTLADQNESLTSTIENLDLTTKQFALLGRVQKAREFSILVPVERSKLVLCGGYTETNDDSTLGLKQVSNPELIEIKPSPRNLTTLMQKLTELAEDYAKRSSGASKENVKTVDYTQKIEILMNENRDPSELAELAIWAEQKDPWFASLNCVYRYTYEKSISLLGRSREETAKASLAKVKMTVVRDGHFDGHLAEVISEAEDHQRK